ncbi:ciliary-associated calcium-binding coiled-coil protein 1-like isoform X1 [Hydra vulgaris]|uniref:Ciliary-associated calcium-binding coiled-coil protein 1-like isoform X1 n=1 Tax=Hydra vulgaris TaxID=6087 RepID=A0ABM4BVG4_HYDVU
MDWKDLLSSSNEELLKLREYSGCDLEIKLIQLMNESSHQTNLKDAALVDCFFNIYNFAQELSLSNEQLMKLFKLYSKLLLNCEKKCSLQCSIDNLKHGLKNPESFEFETSIIKDVIDFLFLFFQHYDLYRYLFTVDQEQQELLKELNFEALPQMQTFPPPLDEAINEEWLRIESINQHLEDIENESRKSNANIKSNVTLDDISKETAENLLSTLTKSKIKLLVNESAEKKLNTVQHNLRQKIEDKEASLLKVLQKFTLS